MSYVLETRPWMVGCRPQLVQRWDPSICIDRTDPVKLPIWVKLYNMPMEACSIKGGSAIASSLGRPIIIDKVTARMCHEGTGRVGYARVLVEIDAEKEFKDKIEICYKMRTN